MARKPRLVKTKNSSRTERLKASKSMIGHSDSISFAHVLFDRSTVYAHGSLIQVGPTPLCYLSYFVAHYFGSASSRDELQD
jgi:hypothetical protein